MSLGYIVVVSFTPSTAIYQKNFPEKPVRGMRGLLARRYYRSNKRNIGRASVKKHIDAH